MSTTRTNIELDDEAVATIMKRYGLKTKREAVEMALQHLAGHPMSREEALAMQGSNILDEDPTEEMEKSWR
ncbi:MAG: type II toxin-antitoxin system VapB family antitoxin [Solirubrobacterales bacterium]